jgi:hypothetical protein
MTPLVSDMVARLAEKTLELKVTAISPVNVDA